MKFFLTVMNNVHKKVGTLSKKILIFPAYFIFLLYSLQVNKRYRNAKVEVLWTKQKLIIIFFQDLLHEEQQSEETLIFYPQKKLKGD